MDEEYLKEHYLKPLAALGLSAVTFMLVLCVIVAVFVGSVCAAWVWEHYYLSICCVSSCVIGVLIGIIISGRLFRAASGSNESLVGMERLQ